MFNNIDLTNQRFVKNLNEDLFFCGEHLTNESVLDWAKPNIEWEEVDDQGGHQEDGAGQDSSHNLGHKTLLFST